MSILLQAELSTLARAREDTAGITDLWQDTLLSTLARAREDTYLPEVYVFKRGLSTLARAREDTYNTAASLTMVHFQLSRVREKTPLVWMCFNKVTHFQLSRVREKTRPIGNCIMVIWLSTLARAREDTATPTNPYIIYQRHHQIANHFKK